ncbi:exodeoxyribonuclease VII small subunit [Blastopirellula retiformator]|uniref:Exodeoxyribonuclease 7 small subunit n=1 Tax=Blastopirellula retiformator TaxID=2527970 RepID=A0A5C5UZ17_9BACT|nr:exodeoxyribonuclease VII small subunit [Blastopirellula retiformator]TWT31594.1 Exodeoxyribonuclease 7 small subunit [Blastopirellula retiformator]
MAKKKAAGEATDAPAFEEELATLETLVRRLESGEAGLEESLKLYEDGVGKLKSCYSLLQRAERKIEVLSGFNAAGESVTENFDEGETTLAEKAESRTKRRGGKSRTDEGDEIDDKRRLF